MGPHHRRRRHHLAPPVAQLLEQLDRLAAQLCALARATAPQRDIREQHAHHPHRPPIAGLAALDRDVLGDRSRFVEPALVVADEREEPVGPAESTPVAELAEEIRRLFESTLRFRDVAVRERDPGEVLQRPRRASLITGGAERSERLGDEPLGFAEIASEEVCHPESAQDIGRARLVVERSPCVEGLSERLLGDLVRPVRGFALTEERERVRLAVSVARGARFGERGQSVVPAVIELAPLDAGAPGRGGPCGGRRCSRARARTMPDRGGARPASTTRPPRRARLRA